MASSEEDGGGGGGGGEEDEEENMKKEANKEEGRREDMEKDKEESVKEENKEGRGEGMKEEENMKKEANKEEERREDMEKDKEESVKEENKEGRGEGEEGMKEEENMKKEAIKEEGNREDMKKDKEENKEKEVESNKEGRGGGSKEEKAVKEGNIKERTEGMKEEEKEENKEEERGVLKEEEKKVKEDNLKERNEGMKEQEEEIVKKEENKEERGRGEEEEEKTVKEDNVKERNEGMKETEEEKLKKEENKEERSLKEEKKVQKDIVKERNEGMKEHEEDKEKKEERGGKKLKEEITMKEANEKEGMKEQDEEKVKKEDNEEEERGRGRGGEEEEEERSDLSMYMETLDIGDVNGNATRAGVPTQALSEVLSDPGRFAYCGLVTGSLVNLFCDTPFSSETSSSGATTPTSPDGSSDFDFALSTMNRLARHLGLPEQVRQVMEMTLRGQVEGSTLKSYVQVLREETTLNRSRLPIVQDLVMFAVQGGCYDARIRVLIMYVTCSLHVSIDLLEMYEESVLEYLCVEEEEVPLTEEEVQEEARRRKYKKIKRYTAIGLATLGGGAVLGLTGGLAAPFIGAGLGTIIGAGGAAAISSTAGVAVVGSMFGAAGAGLTGFKMQKRIGEVEEFAFDYLTDGSHLHITIAISGWLTKEGTEEFFKPWLRLYHSREQYCLRYESQYLLELGKAMDYLLQFALSMAVQETLKYTILAGIISAITWPASLLTLASVIDNPWGVCCRRSAQVGKQLAEVLLRGQHGRRPVTLIGFSLGARVIYYCLQELCRKGSAGIVQDAIMLGAPVPGYAKDWEKFRSVVSGRIINGYCQGDWLLRFLYRSSSGSLRIAGLMPVEWQDRRMFNFDLSQIVTGHMDYAKKMDVILHLLGIRTRDPYNADDPRVKKSASDYPGFTSYHGKLDTSAMRPSSSDSMLVCGHNAPLARSRSSDDLLRSRSSTLLDPSESPLPEENTKPRSLSSYDFATKKCVPLKAVGHQLSPHDIRSRSLASSNVQIDQAGMSRSLGEPEFKEQVASKGYFDFLTRKPQPSTYTSTDKATLAQDKFKRRTVSSGNLFPNKPPRTSGRRELSRTNSQDQPRRQSFFQIFSKKQERIDEA